MAETDDPQRLQRRGQPIFVLSEDAERTQGRDAQQANINASKAIAESVRTTLGPAGMDKMLVSDSGDVVITNDGATILDEMDIEHPAAEMLVEVAEAQEEEVGDGTTTAAILAGELLAEAEEFIDRDIHPRTIVEGYARAERIALEAIDGAVLEGDLDDEVLEQVAETAMTGKGTGGISAGALAEGVVEAVRSVEGDDGVDAEDVRVLAQVGRSASATEVIDGVVAESEPVREDMPRSVADATVAVVDQALDHREAEVDAEYNIESTDQLTAAIEAEESELRDYADAISEAGVDVAFVTDDVADATAGYLSNAGVLVFEDVDDDDADAVATATGASRVGRVEDLEDEDLGTAAAVSVESFDEDTLTFVEGGGGETTATLFVRGGTQHVLDELERTVNDAVDVVVTAVNEGGVVPGAGATEIAIADALREAAAGIEGREQLAVEAFADAVDAIPRTLAQNAGGDPIDALVELRAANEEGRAGLVSAGDDAEIADPVDRGVIDPASVKREAVRSATEAATMIVRIDDVISAE